MSVLAAFLAECAARGFTPDAAQLAAAERLQRLHGELVDFKHRRRSRLRKLLVNPTVPRGVYFWGGVGRGKTLLMDRFFAELPYQRKRRVHFHAFMHDVHRWLRLFKGETDSLLAVAKHIAMQTRVLCFDEFHVSDIADAMILGRLYAALHQHGVVFCMTSNYPPDALYPNGLQRENFLPAIALLKQELDVIEIDGGVDYRLRSAAGAECYLSPADDVAGHKLNASFQLIAGGTGHTAPIEVNGRPVAVLRRAPGVVWFDFASLCGGPRSQNDYLDLARRFPILLLSGVPWMGRDKASEARRFTWLVDVLYDHRVKLLLSAACPAGDLYRDGVQAGEFGRTVSRLVEMRSQEYLAAAHRLD